MEFLMMRGGNFATKKQQKHTNDMKNEIDISPGTASAEFAEKLTGKSGIDEGVRKKILAAYRRGRIDGRNEVIEELRSRRNAPLTQKKWWEQQ